MIHDLCYCHAFKFVFFWWEKDKHHIWSALNNNNKSKDTHNYLHTFYMTAQDKAKHKSNCTQRRGFLCFDIFADVHSFKKIRSLRRCTREHSFQPSESFKFSTRGLEAETDLPDGVHSKRSKCTKYIYKELKADLHVRMGNHRSRPWSAHLAIIFHPDFSHPRVTAPWP